MKLKPDGLGTESELSACVTGGELSFIKEKPLPGSKDETGAGELTVVAIKLNPDALFVCSGVCAGAVAPLFMKEKPEEFSSFLLEFPFTSRPPNISHNIDFVSGCFQIDQSCPVTLANNIHNKGKI
jgi:hypothetical protein